MAFVGSINGCVIKLALNPYIIDYNNYSVFSGFDFPVIEVGVAAIGDGGILNVIGNAALPYVYAA